jgi:hypothetical protein
MGISAGPCLPGATRLWGIMSILQSFTFFLYTQPSVLLSGFPLPPRPPRTTAKTMGRPYCLTFQAHRTPQTAWDIRQYRPGPPKTRGGSFRSAKMAPQDGQVDPQDTPKRMGHPPNPPRWHPKMAKLTPIWPKIVTRWPT